MRKLLIALTICFVIVGVMGCRPAVRPALAEEVNLPNLLAKIPEINQAVIFSLDRNKLDYASTISLVSLFSERIKIDIGYTPKQEIIGLASVKLVEVKNYLNYPILRWMTIEPFVYLGVDRIGLGNGNAKDNNEIDYGVGVKILSLKF